MQRATVILVSMLVLMISTACLISLMTSKGSVTQPTQHKDSSQVPASQANLLLARLHEGSKVQHATYELPTIRKAAAAMNPELMQHAPPQDANFSSSKNPCWTDSAGVLQCLPGLLVLGGFHSGAGSLVHALQRHKDVVTTRSSNSQFWAEDGKSMSEYLAGWREGGARVQEAPDATLLMETSQSTFAFYWSAGVKSHIKYIEHMKPCWEQCVKTHHGNETQREECVGQCMAGSRQADEQAASSTGVDFLRDQHVPLLVHAVYGRHIPRLVVLLRDPIERLHSAYYGYPQYHGKYGATPEGFLAYVEEQVNAFETCAREFGAVRCVFHFETLSLREEKVYYHCDQLLRGLYSLYLEVWLRFFPRDSLLAVRSESLFSDPATEILRTLDHAGLSTVTRETATEWMTSYNIPRHVKGRAILPQARAILHSFYGPYNQRLAEVLGDNQYVEWNEDTKVLKVQTAQSSRRALHARQLDESRGAATRL